MNQNNVNNGRSNGNGSSPDSEKARKPAASWLTTARNQEVARLYAAQLAQDVYNNSSRQTAGPNYGGGGQFLYPSYTAPSIFSPGASQAQVSSSEGAYPHHMLAGTHSIQHQAALAVAAARAYSGTSSILNTGASPNLQSLAVPFHNMRSRLRPTNTTTSTSIVGGPRYLSARLHTPSSQNEHSVRRSYSMSTLQSNRGQSSPLTSSPPPPLPPAAHPLPPLPPPAHPHPAPQIPMKPQTRQHTPPISKHTTAQVYYPDHFRHGSVIRLATGTLKRVEELKTQDFLDSGNISDDLCIDNSTVVKMDNTFSTDTAQLGFSVGSDHIMVTVEATLEHPFFVFGRGWSSCSPMKTLSRYNLVCHQLEVGDICISLTHKESSSSEIISNNSTTTTDVIEKTDVEEPIKVDTTPPLSPAHSSSSATVTRTPSPANNAQKQCNVDSDNGPESPVQDKKRKTCE